MRKLVTVTGGIILGLFLLIAGLSLYAPFIHNQYFSDTAKLARSIKKGVSCQVAQGIIEKYAIRSGEDVGYSASPIASHPEWQHMKDASRIIQLDDDSTPFDHISYYVFCDQQGFVLDTLLVGD